MATIHPNTLTPRFTTHTDYSLIPDNDDNLSTIAPNTFFNTSSDDFKASILKTYTYSDTDGNIWDTGTDIPTLGYDFYVFNDIPNNSYVGEFNPSDINNNFRNAPFYNRLTSYISSSTDTSTIIYPAPAQLVLDNIENERNGFIAPYKGLYRFQIKNSGILDLPNKTVGQGGFISFKIKKYIPYIPNLERTKELIPFHIVNGEPTRLWGIDNPYYILNSGSVNTGKEIFETEALPLFFSSSNNTFSAKIDQSTLGSINYATISSVPEGIASSDLDPFELITNSRFAVPFNKKVKDPQNLLSKVYKYKAPLSGTYQFNAQINGEYEISTTVNTQAGFTGNVTVPEIGGTIKLQLRKHVDGETTTTITESTVGLTISSSIVNDPNVAAGAPTVKQTLKLIGTNTVEDSVISLNESVVLNPNDEISLTIVGPNITQTIPNLGAQSATHKLTKALLNKDLCKFEMTEFTLFGYPDTKGRIYYDVTEENIELPLNKGEFVEVVGNIKGLTAPENANITSIGTYRPVDNNSLGLYFEGVSVESGVPNNYFHCDSSTNNTYNASINMNSIHRDGKFPYQGLEGAFYVDTSEITASIDKPTLVTIPLHGFDKYNNLGIGLMNAAVAPNPRRFLNNSIEVNLTSFSNTAPLRSKKDGKTPIMHGASGGHLTPTHTVLHTNFSHWGSEPLNVTNNSDTIARFDNFGTGFTDEDLIGNSFIPDDAIVNLDNILNENDVQNNPGTIHNGIFEGGDYTQLGMPDGSDIEPRIMIIAEVNRFADNAALSVAANGYMTSFYGDALKKDGIVHFRYPHLMESGSSRCDLQLHWISRNFFYNTGYRPSMVNDTDNSFKWGSTGNKIPNLGIFWFDGGWMSGSNSYNDLNVPGPFRGGAPEFATNRLGRWQFDQADYNAGVIDHEYLFNTDKSPYALVYKTRTTSTISGSGPVGQYGVSTPEPTPFNEIHYFNAPKGDPYHTIGKWHPDYLDGQYVHPFFTSSYQDLTFSEKSINGNSYITDDGTEIPIVDSWDLANTNEGRSMRPFSSSFWSIRNPGDELREGRFIINTSYGSEILNSVSSRISTVPWPQGFWNIKNLQHKTIPVFLDSVAIDEAGAWNSYKNADTPVVHNTSYFDMVEETPWLKYLSFLNPDGSLTNKPALFDAGTSTLALKEEGSSSLLNTYEAPHDGVYYVNYTLELEVFGAGYVHNQVALQGLNMLTEQVISEEAGNLYNPLLYPRLDIETNSIYPSSSYFLPVTREDWGPTPNADRLICGLFGSELGVVGVSGNGPQIYNFGRFGLEPEIGNTQPSNNSSIFNIGDVGNGHETEVPVRDRQFKEYIEQHAQYMKAVIYRTPAEIHEEGDVVGEARTLAESTRYKIEPGVAKVTIPHYWFNEDTFGAGWGLAVWSIPPLPLPPGPPPLAPLPIPIIPPRPIPLNYDHELLISPNPDYTAGHNSLLLYPHHTGILSVGDGTGMHELTYPLDLDPFNDGGEVEYTHTWYEYDLTPDGYIVASAGIDTTGDGIVDTLLPPAIVPAPFLDGWQPGDEYISQLNTFGEWMYGEDGNYGSSLLVTPSNPDFHPVVGMGGSPHQNSNPFAYDQQNAFIDFQSHQWDLDNQGGSLILPPLPPDPDDMTYPSELEENQFINPEVDTNSLSNTGYIGFGDEGIIEVPYIESYILHTGDTSVHMPADSAAPKLMDTELDKPQDEEDGESGERFFLTGDAYENHANALRSGSAAERSSARAVPSRKTAFHKVNKASRSRATVVITGRHYVRLFKGDKINLEVGPAIDDLTLKTQDPNSEYYDPNWPFQEGLSSVAGFFMGMNSNFHIAPAPYQVSLTPHLQFMVNEDNQNTIVKGTYKYY